MTRKQQPLRIVGSREAADMAGMTTTAFKSYRARGQAGIPAPDVVLACGPIWRVEVIEQWLDNRKKGGVKA